MKPARLAAILLTVATVAFLLVPVALSILVGFETDASDGPLGGLTLRWFAQVWSDDGATVGRSLTIAVVTTAVVALAGVPLAYVLATARRRWARVLEELVAVPIAVPGLALALALIEAYGGWGAFRGSSWFIVCGHVLFTLPFLTRSVLAALASSDLETLEAAAAALGAGPAQRFRDVVLPLARPGLVTGALMVFTLSIGEFNLTWMLHTPLTPTLPVGLADAYASLRLEVASAYTTLFFVIVVPVLLVLQWIARRTQARGVV